MANTSGCDEAAVRDAPDLDGEDAVVVEVLHDVDGLVGGANRPKGFQSEVSGNGGEGGREVVKNDGGVFVL